MQQWSLVLLGVLTLTVAQVGCTDKLAAREAWRGVLQKCANNDLLGEDQLYFGPSNNVGPGSAWRKRGQGGGYSLVWPTDLIQPPLPSPVVRPGQPTDCAGHDAETFKGKLSADLVTTALHGVSGGASGALERAKDVQVKVDQWRIDQLAEGPFHAWVQQLPADHPYRTSIGQEQTFVVGRAVRVEGFVATLTFDSATGADVKAKFNPTPASTIANIGVGLQANWTDTTKLELRSSQPFYVAGELNRYNPVTGGVGAGERKLTKAEVKKEDTVKLYYEKPK